MHSPGSHCHCPEVVSQVASMKLLQVGWGGEQPVPDPGPLPFPSSPSPLLPPKVWVQLPCGPFPLRLVFDQPTSLLVGALMFFEPFGLAGPITLSQNWL